MDYVSIWLISILNLNYYLSPQLSPSIQWSIQELVRCGKLEGPECNMPIYLVP